MSRWLQGRNPRAPARALVVLVAMVLSPLAQGRGEAHATGAATATGAAASLGAATATDAAASPGAGADLFVRMATVLQHPRCMNCHSGESFPRQGDDAHRHRLNVSRGPSDHGAPGLHCSTCHQSVNQDLSGVPGAPSWGLAPVRMKWTGLTVGELCRALLDPSRGGMMPEQFAPHFQTGLVRWAWTPGQDSEGRRRTVPPIPFAEFMDLTGQWVAAGVPCPP